MYYSFFPLITGLNPHSALPLTPLILQQWWQEVFVMGTKPVENVSVPTDSLLRGLNVISL